MRSRSVAQAVTLAGALLILSGCGADNNLFSGFADDNSRAAKIEEAQMALDRGDCQTAIDGFTEVFNSEPTDVDIRIGLAAAYGCRAGISVAALIGIAADYVAGGSNPATFDLFRAIEEGAVSFVSASWDADTAFAGNLLTDAGLATVLGCVNPEVAYAYDPLAAFDRSIYAMIRASMAIASIQEPNGDILSTVLASGTFAQDLLDTLIDADNSMACANDLVGGNLLLNSDLSQAINDLEQTLDLLDGFDNDTITAVDLEAYLIAQGYNVI